MYSAMDIAKYILFRFTEMGRPITNLKLQKLLFFIQRESLRINDEPMFNELIEAWQFGPVVPAVYYKFAAAGASELFEFTDPLIEFDMCAKDIIENIILKYKDSNPWVMVDETHNENTSWDRAMRTGVYKPIIEWDDIRKYG